uniref:WD_REPEATS_REGION domain-containing protein n=1 Tax=Heterorhabditis bacteriophora TaxID=37862 RepID=A0A1I7WS26_HETBA
MGHLQKNISFLHSSKIISICTLDDGRVFSCDEDGQLCLWEIFAEDGSVVCTDFKCTSVIKMKMIIPTVFRKMLLFRFKYLDNKRTHIYIYIYIRQQMRKAGWRCGQLRRVY